jgi:hypothetical protein
MSSPPAEVPLVGALPALRLLPAPSSEPPYDDELPGQPLSPAGPLRPLRTWAPAPLRLVPTTTQPDGPPRATATAPDLPPARPVAQALVQGLLEVLAGVRPVSQLQRGTSPELFSRLEQVVRGRPRPGGARPGAGAVRSLHVQEQPGGVAEVCATVRRGPRLGAIALRLEGSRGRWCCTELAGL